MHSMQDASDLYNADYAQTEELFRRLLSSSAGASAACWRLPQASVCSAC